MPPPFDAAMRMAAAHPGAAVSQPFGPGVEVWKVGGRIFAAVAAPGACVKCTGIDEAAHLIALGLAQKAPYFHPSWVQIPLGSDILGPRIAASYATIVAGLPKRLRPAGGSGA